MGAWPVRGIALAFDHQTGYARFAQLPDLRLTESQWTIRSKKRRQDAAFRNSDCGFCDRIYLAGVEITLFR